MRPRTAGGRAPRRTASPPASAGRTAAAMPPASGDSIEVDLVGRDGWARATTRRASARSAVRGGRDPSGPPSSWQSTGCRCPPWSSRAAGARCTTRRPRPWSPSAQRRSNCRAPVTACTATHGSCSCSTTSGRASDGIVDCPRHQVVQGLHDLLEREDTAATLGRVSLRERLGCRAVPQGGRPRRAAASASACTARRGPAGSSPTPPSPACTATRRCSSAGSARSCCSRCTPRPCRAWPTTRATRATCGAGSPRSPPTSR